MAAEGETNLVQGLSVGFDWLLYFFSLQSVQADASGDLRNNKELMR